LGGGRLAGDLPVRKVYRLLQRESTPKTCPPVPDLT
jgi:hypothetical protein